MLVRQLAFAATLSKPLFDKNKELLKNVARHATSRREILLWKVL
jgi:hypothetical protein